MAHTFKRHGATQDEIDFLLQGSCGSRIVGKRVELNAIASNELIAFIDSGSEEHGVRKIIPEDDILELPARRMLERQMVLQALTELLPNIRKQAAETILPDDLRRRLQEQFNNLPELPWDAAIAKIIQSDGEDGDHIDEGSASHEPAQRKAAPPLPCLEPRVARR